MLDLTNKRETAGHWRIRKQTESVWKHLAVVQVPVCTSVSTNRG